MIPIRSISIYDKNSMKFSFNIKKSINIVKYRIHQYDTHNTYVLTISITTSLMDILCDIGQLQI